MTAVQVIKILFFYRQDKLTYQLFAAYCVLIILDQLLDYSERINKKSLIQLLLIYFQRSFDRDRDLFTARHQLPFRQNDHW